MHPVQVNDQNSEDLAFENHRGRQGGAQCAILRKIEKFRFNQGLDVGESKGVARVDRRGDRHESMERSPSDGGVVPAPA